MSKWGYFCVKGFKRFRQVADVCLSPQSGTSRRLFALRIMLRLVCEFTQFPLSPAIMSFNVNTVHTNK